MCVHLPKTTVTRRVDRLLPLLATVLLLVSFENRADAQEPDVVPGSTLVKLTAEGLNAFSLELPVHKAPGEALPTTGIASMDSLNVFYGVLGIRYAYDVDLASDIIVEAELDHWIRLCVPEETDLDLV